MSDVNGGVKEQSGEKDPETRDRLGWYPTPAEFRAYLDRELELAKMNLARGIPKDATLHSPRTITFALEAQGEERKT
jgi:hypothetical protein